VGPDFSLDRAVMAQRFDRPAVVASRRQSAPRILKAPTTPSSRCATARISGKIVVEMA
jgi:hypothetical protein